MLTRSNAPSRVWSAFLLAATISSPSVAGVLVVDPTPGMGYPEIQYAIDAAVPGDTILIKANPAGSYLPITLPNKTLTLVGEGDVHVGGVFGVGAGSTIANLAADRSLVLRNLKFHGAFRIPFSYSALVATNCAGSLWIDSCEFNGAGGQTGGYGLNVTSCSRVVITRCFARGKGGPNDFIFGVSSALPGLRAELSDVYLYDSTFEGGSGSTGASGPGHILGSLGGSAGVAFAGGSGLLNRCVSRGGKGGDGFLDYTGAFCYPPRMGGPGLWLASPGATVQTAGCTFIPGPTGAIPPGNPTQPCASVGTAPPALVDAGTLTELFADPGELVVPTPLREGQNLTLTLSGAVGSQGFLIAAADSSAPVAIPALGGALHLGNPVVVIPLGAIPASGTLSSVFPLPILPHAALTLDYYLQGATCAAVGGCALAGPAVLIVLDSVF